MFANKFLLGQFMLENKKPNETNWTILTIANYARP